MDIEYKGVRGLLRDTNKPYPMFNLFNDRGIAVKVLCWQPEGDITFSEETGFVCCSSEHLEKSTAFLSLAKSKNVDIVLTPEYTIPWTVLDDLLKNEALWPSYGKLWALGMQGTSLKALKEFVSSSNEKTNIYCEDLESVSGKAENRLQQAGYSSEPSGHGRHPHPESGTVLRGGQPPDPR